MNADVVIVGAGPAGIFTALEMLRRGSKKKIVMVEKGRALEKRSCPKAKTGVCMNCKPVCHITTGFSGAGAFSDGKLSLACEVGGDLPTLIGERLAQETIDYADKIYLELAPTSTSRASATRRRSAASAPAPSRPDSSSWTAPSATWAPRRRTTSTSA